MVSGEMRIVLLVKKICCFEFLSKDLALLILKARNHDIQKRWEETSPLSQNFVSNSGPMSPRTRYLQKRPKT